VRKLSGLFVITLTLMSSVEVSANCQRWECRVRFDTASCWILAGPISQGAPLATSCNSTCDCMFDDFTGSLLCNCYCTYNYCYDV